VFLIVGLGNPGSEYAKNRHNIGFMAVDVIAENFKFSNFSHKFSGLFAQGNIGEHKVLLLKPQTFMNRSGASVLAAAQFYKILPEKIIVLHDELDLPINKLRVKQAGSNGGHNGLKDIDRLLGVNYWRVRIGIDRPLHKEQVTGHVLGNFTSDELAVQEPLLERIAKFIPDLLDGDANRFMTKISG